MKAPSSLLNRVAEIRDKAPAARRAILEAVLADPDRVLEESFEQLAERAGSSVPTIMRTCRDLGFAGLREFKLGAFLLAAHTGVPVVPVGIRGARSILRDVSWFPRLGAAAVAIGDPIMPAGNDWAAAVHLRDRAREEILRLSGEPERLGLTRDQLASTAKP